MSEVKQTAYTCDICGAKIKVFNPPKLPSAIGWIRIVRKKRRKDICFGCVSAIRLESECIEITERKISEASDISQV